MYSIQEGGIFVEFSVLNTFGVAMDKCERPRKIIRLD